MHKFQYRVYYEDTDAGGVVYYANYLKFAERARTDFLRAKGIVQSQYIAKNKLFFVVRRVTMELLKPARLDDLLDVHVTIQEKTAIYVTMRQEFFCQSIMLACVDVDVVCVNDAMKPVRFPQEIIF